MWQCELIADLEQERLGPATLVRTAWSQGGRR
jgi:hypothetical protein